MSSEKDNDDKHDNFMSMRAGLDQAGAAIKEMSPLLWGLYTSLTEEGFTPQQAMQLVVAWFIDSMGQRPE